MTDGCKPSPSIIRRLSWYEMTQLDAQEYVEAPRGMFWRDGSSAQIPVQVVGKLSSSKEAPIAEMG